MGILCYIDASTCGGGFASFVLRASQMSWKNVSSIREVDVSASEIMLRLHGPVSQLLIDALQLEVEVTETTEALAFVEKQRFLRMRQRQLKAVRKNRADDGKPVFGPKGLAAVKVDTFVDDLLKNNYTLVDHFAEKKPRWINGRLVPDKFKTVATLIFSREKDTEPVKNYNETIALVKGRLANFIGEYCHVWQNDHNDTVNLTGHAGKAKFHLRLNDASQVTSDPSA